MIEVLLLSASFMIILLIMVLVLAFHVKTWAYKKEEENQKRFNELTKRIDETQRLFKTEVTEILSSFKKILGQKDK